MKCNSSLPQLLIAAGTVALLLPSGAFAEFTGGPAARVSPNSKLEIRWIADFFGDGKVEIFDNPDAIGTPIASDVTAAPGNDHTIVFNVGGAIQADTKYHFKIIHKDPNGNLPDLTNPTPLPPVFSGAQAISNLRVESITTDSATISWDANVIGFGSVIYGTMSLDQGPVADTNNISNHAIVLTGLSPGTTYSFEASNQHAIDGDKLATAIGQFTTAPIVADVVLTGPNASPRVIDTSEVSTISVVAKDRGNPVAGVVVTFSTDPESQGSGNFGGASSAQATTDASGRASVQFTATARGNVHVNAASPSARNSLKIAVVVRRN